DGKKLEWGEIVGIASDIQSIFPDQNPTPWQLYQPMAQEPRPGHQIAVRAGGAAPSALVAGIRAAMATLDGDLPVRDLQPAATTVEKARYSWQVVGSMLSFLAVIGLALASVGMYGVISRTMAQRRVEFGIRLALGALASDITRLVLASGAKLALAGAALGLVGAFGVSRLLASIFPGLATSRVPVLGGVTLLLMGIALLASYTPARSASRIDPVETLRAE
ncbi:MAG TPA: FtsX-like permease family protein, partial [Verrucomicrobiae bacterium]|nr:FtsX-like permease family protein [Verrucomicrobiae bacterium]